MQFILSLTFCRLLFHFCFCFVFFCFFRKQVIVIDFASIRYDTKKHYVILGLSCSHWLLKCRSINILLSAGTSDNKSWKVSENEKTVINWWQLTHNSADQMRNNPANIYVSKRKHVQGTISTVSNNGENRCFNMI